MIEDILKSSEVIMSGGIIIYPTDTIWGIGCDATNEAAVKKIYEIKKRPDAKSMITLVNNETMLFYYAGDFPDVAMEIINISDKPLTIIYPHPVGLALNLLAEDGSAGIRVTNDRFCAELIKKTGKPVVSTSANISGMSWPKTFTDIDTQIRDAVDYVVKWRQDERKPAKPSGIVKVWPDGSLKVIRE